MRYEGEERDRPRRVNVLGRTETGLVVSEGVNIGVNPAIYCVVVLFEETGEVAYYKKEMVTTAHSDGP
jgi:hypothetical protein